MKIKTIIMIIVTSILIYSSYDVNAEESIVTDLTSNAGVSQSANRDDLTISYIPNEYNKTYPPLGTAYYPNDNYYINRFHIRSYNANVKKFIKGYYYNVEYVLYTNPIYEFLYCGTPGEASCSNESNNFMIMSAIFDQILMYGAPNPNYDTTSQNYISELSCSIGTRISTYEWTINCSFSPTRDLHGIYTAFYTDTTFYGSFQAKFPWYNMNQFRVQSVEITQNTGLEGAIDNQTQIIINGNNEINNNLEGIKDTITGDYEYEDTPLEDIQGKEEIDEMKEIEEGILGSLDLSATDTLDITINPNASKFIWDIVEELRGINAKIVMLITSILGLGIIKMILNR